MDLVGMEARDRRAKMKLTVLEQQTSWSNDEVSKLVSLPPDHTVGGHPQHPGTLVILGEHTRATIEGVITDQSFSHKIVTGYDNPELPFKPSLI